MKKIRLLHTLLFSVFAVTMFPAENMNFHFRKIQVDDGLSENTVYCTLQDSKGFIWLGTKDGLNRTDGSNFRVFRHSISNPSSLGSNTIRSIAEGADSILYIGTDAGLYIMNTVHETFTLLTLETLEEKRLTTAVNSLFKDKDGRIWIGSMRQGVLIYDPSKQTLRQVRIKEHNSGHNAVWTIYADRSGTIWVGTRWGLLRYNAEKGDLEAVEGLFSPSKNSGNEIFAILEDPKGYLWLGTRADGVRFFDKQRYYDTSYLGLQSETDSITYVRALYQYDDTHILIGAGNGLYLFNIKDKEGKRIDIPQSQYSMSDQHVYSITNDHEGGIWIGTYWGGVNYLNTSLLPVETYYADVKHGMLSGKVVSRFCEDENGNMWIATEDGGVNYLDVTTKQITQPIQTSYHNTHALLPDGENLWIGTFSRGIDVYNTRTGKLSNYKSDARDEFTLNDDRVFSIYQTKNGDIYVGTPIGLNKYDREKDRFIRVKELAAFIYDIKEDDRGDLWVATYGNGIARLDSKTGKWIFYDSLAGSKLTGIFMDSRKRLIFSSEGKGIFVYNDQTDTFRNISEAEGLPDNVVYGVLDGPDGNLWLSCNKGIVCFDVENPAGYKLYNKEEGLQSNQFNYKASYKARDGKFYFGGINGFSCFYPQDLSQLRNGHVPPVQLTEIRLLGDSSDIHQDIQTRLNQQQPIVFQYYKSSFTISYTGLSFQTQSKNEYAYMLEGADEDWTHAGQNKNVTYANLRPGKYTFKVKASNNSGLWNEEGAQIDIEILPPFWLSLPAKLLYLVLSIALICLLVSCRRKKRRN